MREVEVADRQLLLRMYPERQRTVNEPAKLKLRRLWMQLALLEQVKWQKKMTVVVEHLQPPKA